jgi:thiamine transport system ATP-binding protein
MLALDDLAFAYDGGPSYRFSLRVAPGEIVAVAGASGSGKSTLLDLIAGFLVPVGGTIALDGRDLASLPPEARPVSILLQSELLFEHLTAGANVALGLRPGTPALDRHRRVAEALDAVGLAGLTRQRSATLSGGEKQRVALARTLLRDRPVLLLDEPFSALDDAARTEVRELVARLTKNHRWHTLLVTHSGQDIEAIADRRYRLEDGRLLG